MNRRHDDALIAFYRARLDEADALATAAANVDPSPWTASTSSDNGPDIHREVPVRAGSGVVYNADDENLWETEGSSTLCMLAPSARHAAHHHPQAVLADIAAKRQLLAKFEAGVATAISAALVDLNGGTIVRTSGLRKTIAVLATAYRLHPDYLQEFAPTP